MDTNFANQLISALLQVGFVLLLGAIVWALLGRRKAGFARFLGLYPAPSRALLAGAAIGLALPLLTLAVPAMRELASAPDSVPGAASRQLDGGALVAVLLVLAIFKTAFAEELLFRGIFGKQLIAWLGFAVGNVLQALLFGAVHLLILFVAATPEQRLAGTVFILIATLFGWINGWLNERMGGGSILPGWAAHATANTLTYLAVGLLASP